jgi:hypothetical protein
MNLRRIETMWRMGLYTGEDDIDVLEDDSTWTQRGSTRRHIHLIRRALSLPLMKEPLPPLKSIKPPISPLISHFPSLLTQTISLQPHTSHKNQTKNQSTCLQTPSKPLPSVTSMEGVMAAGVLFSVISTEGVMVGGALFRETHRSHTSMKARGRGCPGVVFGPKVPDEVFR